MRILCTFILSLMLSAVSTTKAQVKWMNPMDADVPNINGRAWNAETGKTYNRLPERLKGSVPKRVWDNSTLTAGLSVRFTTTSHTVRVKYVCTSPHYGSYNMSGIDHSGIDLYGKTVDGATHWIGSHMNWQWNGDTTTISFADISVPTPRGLEYTLYLPNYNGIKWLAVGVDNDADFNFIPPSIERPVVVYGSSIIHGASPSRPGMAITNIVERETEYPFINLGFSGSAYMEPEVFSMLGEINARAFIIDPIPNSNNLPDTAITSRAVAGVKMLRAKSSAPILLCENHPIPDSVLHSTIADKYRRANIALHKAYLELKAVGVGGLYYMYGSEICFTEDDMIEGVHPNDIGCRAYAEAYKKHLQEMLPEDAPDPRYRPVTQRRDGCYEWRLRHNAVLERNRTVNPEILMIGNSITNFWGGSPTGGVCNGGNSWKKLFGKRSVTNMGFGWDRIENVYWRIFHGELEGCSPKHICLMIGINNIGDSAEDIAGGISRLASLIRKRQPQARLHIIKLLPARGHEEKTAKVNSLLDTCVTTDSHTDLIDMTADLLLGNGSGNINPKFFLSDGLHPNEQGYAIMAKRLAKILK